MTALARSARLLALAAAVTLGACGGGTSPSPPAPPPPAAVATVTVSPTSASLTVHQTQSFTATTKDAAGNVLSGRSVNWTTTPTTVATVSGDGLVTAVGPGSATITATSEGKSGSATLSVTDGGVVDQGGGTVQADGGNVTLTIPAGATTGSVAVTVTPATDQPALPEGINSVSGTAYTFGPEGTTFSAPVTVTVKYDPAKAPGWAIPSDFALYHYNGTAWEVLPGLAVDAVAHTVSGRTSSFSPFTIGTRLPPATLTPSPGSVNINQRSVVFTASLAGHPTSSLQFAWQTTGLNGTISPLIGADAQYTMTQASLPPGDLDEVQVIVRGNINPATPNVVVPLASAEAIVNSNLNATFEVNPDESTPGFGQTQNLDALVRNKDGTIYTAPGNLPVLMVWTSSDLHGSLDIANPNHKTDISHGVYTAKVQSQSVALPPRVDQITVDFYVGYLKSYVTPISQFGQTIQRVDSIVARFDVKSGTTNAFVEVAPKTYLANFKVRTIPSPGGSCVTADAVVPKVAGATSYDLTVTGIVGSALGTTYHKVFSGTTSTGSILDIYDTGSYYGVPMDGGCATTQQAITARQNLYQNQFGNANFTVKTTP